MNLRFSLKEVTVCGDSGTFDNLNTALTVFVANELVATVNPFITVPAFPYTTANGIVVTGFTDYGGGEFLLSIALPNIWNEALVRIHAEKVGLLTFDNTFKVFGYDIGNNIGLGINHNPDLKIYLVPPDVAFAAFAHWTQPFTNTEYVYYTTSTEGKINYRASTDDSIISNSRNPIRCCKDVIDVYQHVEIHEGDCGCDGEPVIEEVCDSSGSIATKYKLIPDFEFDVTCENCCEDVECFTELGDNKIIPDINIASIDQMWVDDVLGYNPDIAQIGFDLLDYSGAVIQSGTNTVDLTIPFVAEDYAFDFVIPERGDYLIKFYLYLDGVYRCVKSKVIKGCHYYDIKKIGCRTFSFANYSQLNTSVLVQKLDDTGVFQDLETITITTCEAIEYVFAVDGVYNLQYTNDNDEVENLIVVVDCDLRECLVSHIHKLACHKKETCSCGGNCNQSCKGTPQDLYNFNAVMALGYGFYSLVNKEYLDYYIYAILEPTDLVRFHNINQFLNRVKEYCKECKDSGSTSKCGCGK